ncbi:MAG: energy-coupling factor transporter transmembrane protein EcfT [Promethearchaeota archaeon]|nr:MAG: energy-coupling factor transporter transmembrane protein EcfT [Candidatus Lokiarchaeota archaeon]
MVKRKNKNKILDKKQYLFAYVPGNSIFHKLNPLSKLFFLIFLTIITLVSNSLIFMAFIFLIVLLMALLSGISLMNLIHKLKFIVMILIVSVILNIFFNAIPNEEEVILFYLLGLKFLPIRKLAVYYALKAMFIVLILYTSTIIYTNTTDIRDFVYALMKLKIPYRYCFALMVGIRYIPIIEEEARTISLAQRARGFGLEKVNSVKKAYRFIFERLIATLVVVLRKAYVTSISMENRCFGIYKERTNLIEIKFKLLDIVFMIIVSIIFVGILFYLFQLLPLPQFPSLYRIFLKNFK